MDSLDKALLCELSTNARVSYQALARKFSISPNTVKNRINKLCQQKVILKFGVALSMEMIGAEHLSGVISTDGSEKVIEFMEQIATQPMVMEIYRTSDRRYEFWAIVEGVGETLGFQKFLEALDSVDDVEIRPIEFYYPNHPPNFCLNTRGKKVSFTQNQLRVLRCLTEDGRMPIAQIARQTKLTPRRVRKILRELEKSGGVHITTRTDFLVLGDMEYRLKIDYDATQITGNKIIDWIYEKYPHEFWWASVTTNEPIVDVGLLLDSPGKSMLIISEIKGASFTREVVDFLSYPRVVRGNARPRIRLEEMLREAGL